jgi:hypothetical protein
MHCLGLVCNFAFFALDQILNYGGPGPIFMWRPEELPSYIGVDWIFLSGEGALIFKIKK